MPIPNWLKVVKINFDAVISLRVYPNPVTNGILFIEYSGGKINDMKLITADGKQLACGFIKQADNSLKVSLPITIAKGTYVLQLNTDNGLLNAKIIVQ